MKKLLLIPVLSSVIFAIDFCGEKVYLGDKVNLQNEWKSKKNHLERETNFEICKIYKDESKVVKISKTIKKDFLIIPDELKIQYLKIKYDDNSIILEEEIRDQSLIPLFIKSKQDRILSIDSGYKNNKIYTKMYSKCKIPGKLCINTIEKGILNTK